MEFDTLLFVAFIIAFLLFLVFAAVAFYSGFCLREILKHYRDGKLFFLMICGTCLLLIFPVIELSTLYLISSIGLILAFVVNFTCAVLGWFFGEKLFDYLDKKFPS